MRHAAPQNRCTSCSQPTRTVAKPHDDSHVLQVSPSPEPSRQRLPGISRGVTSSCSPSHSPSRNRSQCSYKSYSPPPGSPFIPLQLLPMPPLLCFETWWQEGGQMVHVWVDYDTVTQMATARCVAGCPNPVGFCRFLTVCNNSPIISASIVDHVASCLGVVCGVAGGGAYSHVPALHASPDHAGG